MKKKLYSKYELLWIFDKMIVKNIMLTLIFNFFYVLYADKLPKKIIFPKNSKLYVQYMYNIKAQNSKCIYVDNL